VRVKAMVEEKVRGIRCVCQATAVETLIGHQCFDVRSSWLLFISFETTSEWPRRRYISTLLVLSSNPLAPTHTNTTLPGDALSVDHGDGLLRYDRF